MAVPVIFNPNRDFANASESATDLNYATLQSETLLAYMNQTVLASLVNRGTVDPGSLYRDVLLLHKAGSEFHIAGEEMLGMDIAQRTRRIYLDERPRVSSYYFDDFQSMLAATDSRMKVAMQAGSELAEQLDKAAYRLIVMASRTAAGSNPDDPFLGGGTNGNGTGYVAAALGTANAAGAQAVLAAIDQAVALFAQRNVPFNGRHCIINPDLFYEIPKLEKFTSGGTATNLGQVFGNRDVDMKNKQFTDAYSQQEPLHYRGFEIRWSNLLVQDDGSTDAPNRQISTATTEGILFQTDGIALVEKMPIAFETSREATKGADFMVAKSWIGGGVIRPECCIELRTS